MVNDIAFFEKRIQENLPEGSINYYKTYIQPLGETHIKTWLARQVYISLGIFLAACADLGIDSTPMEGIELDKYDEVLNNKEYKTLFAATIGERDGNDANQPSVKPKLRLNKELVLQEL